MKTIPVIHSLPSPLLWVAATTLSCSLLLSAPQSATAAGKSDSAAGCYVRNGTLMHHGKPYAGIGANYDTLLGRLIENKENTSTLTNLELLAKKGIPFVRFRASGFRSRNWDLYLHDRPEYFRRFDLVVRAAEKEGIGLLPSLFWKLGTIAQVAGESPRELGNSRSKTNALIRRYTREVVERYKDSPAIWGWEFGNAPNMVVDLAGRKRKARSGADEESGGPDEGAGLSSHDVLTAMKLFAETVRSIDPHRMIEAGNSIPRPGAWHLARGGPRQRDSAAQTYEMLARLTPDPMDMTSVHIYFKPQRLAPYGPETLSQFLTRFVRATAQRGKPLFIGEFPLLDRARATETLQAIKENRVPLSAFWVFDHPSQEALMNVSFENERAFLLDLVAQANRELNAAVGASSKL